MVLGLVLWVDENTFSTSLLEKVFKKKGLPFYTISSSADFLYLVHDLKPEVLVIDSITGRKNLDSLKRESLEWSNIPVILIEDDSELAFLQNKIGVIKRPFDPFEIPKVVQDFMKVN